MSNRLLVFSIVASGWLFACGGGKPAESAPPRSPTTDYPHPAARSADGQVVGADGVPPEDRMRASPKVGSGGVTPAEGPGGGTEVHETECKDGGTAAKPCKKPGPTNPTPKK